MPKSPVMRATIILGLLYVTYWMIFQYQAANLSAELVTPLTPYRPVFTAAEWTFKVVAYTLFARGVLGLFLNLERPITFFVVLQSVTDPFLALTKPITPSFLVERLIPFYAAFLFFAIGWVAPIATAILLLRVLS